MADFGRNNYNLPTSLPLQSHNCKIISLHYMNYEDADAQLFLSWTYFNSDTNQDTEFHTAVEVTQRGEIYSPHHDRIPTELMFQIEAILKMVSAV